MWDVNTVNANIFEHCHDASTLQKTILKLRIKSLQHTREVCLMIVIILQIREQEQEEVS